MQHALITPQSESELLATLAAGAMETASRQQTRTAGSATYHNPNGTKTLIGADASGSGIAPWVGDTTPPGRPTGVSAESGAGLVLVSWDGSLDGGVPQDFDHVQILVDGKDAGRLAAKGTLACGPYEPGTEHTVSAVAWDDAHAEDGSPAPNASHACAPIRVTVTGADVDPSRLGITVTKSDKDPQGKGEHTGDLWLKYEENYSDNIVKDPNGENPNDWDYNGLEYTSSVDSNNVKHFRTRPNSANPKGEGSWSELICKNSTSPALHNGDTVTISVSVKGENADTTKITPYLGIKAGNDGFNEGLFPVPFNNSGWVTLSKTITIKNAKASGSTYNFGLTVYSTEDKANSVILATGFSFRVLGRSALSNEWWWDGSKWVQIPIAIYLDQLAARDVQVDSAVIGMLAAGIIKSGTFVTSDGLVGFDSTGFWAKDATGGKVFTAGKDGVRAVGGFATATSGNRIIMSQTLVKGTRIGGIQGQDSDDTNTPNWFIWGYGSHTAQDGYPSLQMGVTPQMPEIQASRGPNGSVSSLTANYVTVQGSDVTDIAGGTAKVTARRFEVRGIPADFEDYNPSAWMGWSDSYEDYNHATRLYKRAGVYFLELAIKLKWGMIPSMQTIPVVRLAESIMPDHSLDVLAYGTSYAVGRVHVFGPGESQPQGTISIGTKDTTANFFSAQLFWNDPRKA